MAFNLSTLMAAAGSFLAAREARKKLLDPNVEKKVAILAFISACDAAGIDRVFPFLADYAIRDVRALREALVRTYPGLTVDPE